MVTRLIVMIYFEDLLFNTILMSQLLGCVYLMLLDTIIL